MTESKRPARRPSKPRDPFWRQRRAFVETKTPTGRVYRRAKTRAIERAAARRGDGSEHDEG